MGFLCSDSPEHKPNAFSDSLRHWQVRVSLTGSTGYLGLVLLQLQSHLFFWDELASDKASADASQGDICCSKSLRVMTGQFWLELQ